MLFFGPGFSSILQKVSSNIVGANLFAYEVNDPSRFGIVEIGKNGDIYSISEKPEKPKSNLAVTGLYFYDNSVVEITKSIIPSFRGEREITAVNNIYLKEKKIKVKILGRGFTWLDTGTNDSFLTASQFIQMLIKQQGLQIACLEEIAWRQKWISDEKLERHSAFNYNNQYGFYLKKLLTSQNLS